MKRGLLSVLMTLVMPVMMSAGAFAEGLVLSIGASQGSDGVITFDGVVEDTITRVKCDLNNADGTTEQSGEFEVSEGKFAGTFTAEMKGYKLNCANAAGGDAITAEILQPDMKSINEAKEAAAKVEAENNAASSTETTDESGESSDAPNLIPIIVTSIIVVALVAAGVGFIIIRKKRSIKRMLR